jgi:hypothetical protein
MISYYMKKNIMVKNINKTFFLFQIIKLFFIIILIDFLLNK